MGAAEGTWHQDQTHQISAREHISEPERPRRCGRQIAKYRRAHPLDSRFLCTSHSEPHNHRGLPPDLHHGLDRHIVLESRGAVVHYPRRHSPSAVGLLSCPRCRRPSSVASSLALTCQSAASSVFVVTPLPRKLVPTSFVPRPPSLHQPHHADALGHPRPRPTSTSPLPTVFLSVLSVSPVSSPPSWAVARSRSRPSRTTATAPCKLSPRRNHARSLR